MTAGTGAPATGSATGTGAGTGTGSTGATGTGTTTDDGTDDGSGDGGTGDKPMDADAWKRQARKLERERNDLKTRLDGLENLSKTETEKAIEKARQEGRDEASGIVAAVRAEAAILTAATGSLAKPEDALAFLKDDLSDFVQRDGTVDRKAIDAAIAKLVKERPYLAAAGNRTAPLPGNRATQATGSDFNTTIRQQIGRRG